MSRIQKLAVPPHLKHISHYTEEALSARCNEAHVVTEYSRHAEYGVIQINFFVGLTATAKFTFLAVVPALIYAGDQMLNDGGLCTAKGPLYFDEYSGDRISFSAAEKNRDRNRQAEQLNRHGTDLLSKGQYHEAYEKFDQANNKCTTGYSQQTTFQSNKKKAHMEMEAADLNTEGDRLFSEGKYIEAVRKYQQAYDQSKDGTAQKTFESNREAAAKKAGLQLKNQQAEELNREGNDLFYNRRLYKEAYEKYSQACNLCTHDYSQKDEFEKNRAKTQLELKAVDLNTEGDRLFAQGKFSEATDKYQQAYNMSQVTTEKMFYKLNRETAAKRIQEQLKNAQVDQLNHEGDLFYNQEQYRAAYEKYDLAYNITSDYAEKAKFKQNSDAAKKEADAADLNAEGDRLFHQGKFGDAQSKYQQAHEISQVSLQRAKYESNKEKARLIEGMQRNMQAEQLHQSKQSVVGNEQEIYKPGPGKSLTVFAKKMWNEAWQAEDDDRSEVAISKFQEANKLFHQALQLAPADREILGLSNACSLKIEGNEQFNEGIKFQQDGVRLLQEAKQLERQQRYKRAKLKLKEAELKLLYAMESFESGIVHDRRFVSCLELANQQVKDIVGSIKMIHQQIINQNFQALDLRNGQQEESDFPPAVNASKEQHYNAQI
ncbi:titin homolog [Sabethes cyaneus]|uniref:titin homolog n=1 Tax=Sabethes cyaneus TaxID=53552 RepID=UPI00237EBF4D|nr:titin homolog [Sabethes cyaneus]XP_053693711.1 titin homolog [Sabethes cyaneus]XP_053693720.1 titin homolog [Sabethes cyaneus]XP_053693728.1 titin homolog [Sabethes cyaneus]